MQGDILKLDSRAMRAAFSRRSDALSSAAWRAAAASASSAERAAASSAATWMLFEKAMSMA
jgi:hypothetical protein